MVTTQVGLRSDGTEPTLYEAVGGAAFFERLIDEFYNAVEADDLLIARYPTPHDPVGSRQRFCLFLIQYWGGPTTYSDQRGHPRLRMRHAPFEVDEVAIMHWLGAMRHALDLVAPPPSIDAILWRYFLAAAEAMRNA